MAEDRDPPRSASVRQRPLQLDELRLAERSPLRAAVEDDEGRAAAAGVVEIDHRARLIGEADVRKALAFDRTDSLEVPRTVASSFAPLRSGRRWLQRKIRRLGDSYGPRSGAFVLPGTCGIGGPAKHACLQPSPPH